MHGQGRGRQDHHRRGHRRRARPGGPRGAPDHHRPGSAPHRDTARHRRRTAGLPHPSRRQVQAYRERRDGDEGQRPGRSRTSGPSRGPAVPLHQETAVLQQFSRCSANPGAGSSSSTPHPPGTRCCCWTPPARTTARSPATSAGSMNPPHAPAGPSPDQGHLVTLAETTPVLEAQGLQRPGTRGYPSLGMGHQQLHQRRPPPGAFLRQRAASEAGPIQPAAPGPTTSPSSPFAPPSPPGRAASPHWPVSPASPPAETDYTGRGTATVRPARDIYR